MRTPRTHHDPVGDKRRALRHAAIVCRRVDADEEVQRAVILFASHAGASSQEIADATGVAHDRVRRILERVRAAG